MLEEKGIENYCPLNKVRRKWKDRKKIVLEPLFKGYLFVKIDEEKKWDIKMIDGILNYVYWLGKPARVKEAEINTIKKFLNEFENVDVVELDLKANTNVIVTKGILMNYKGIVLEVVGNKVKVQIDSMGIRLSAVIEKGSLEQIREL